jgi:hypothetical protein
MKQNRTHVNIAKELGRCILPVTKDALKKRGFFEYRLIEEWPLIVGEHMARYSSPLKVSFEINKRTDGVLHIQVGSAMALEFQHLQPIILDRISTYFGYKAIARLTLHQGGYLPLPAQPASVVHPAPMNENLSAIVASCTDEDLRNQLASLGTYLSAKNNR